MLSNHLILCHPLLLLPSIFSSISVFPNEAALHIRWPKFWSFSFSISPSNDYSELISFRIDWFDLLAIQGLLKSLLQKKKCLLQHHNSRASILQHSAFFMVQLSHPYMTTRKTIVLTIRTCALGTRRQIATPLFSTLQHRTTPLPPVVTAQNISRHCHMSPGRTELLPPTPS